MVKKSLITIVVIALVAGGVYFFHNRGGLIGTTYAGKLAYPGVVDWGDGFGSSIDSEHNLVYVTIDGRNAILLTHTNVDSTRTVLDILYYPDGVTRLNSQVCGPDVGNFKFDPEVIVYDMYDRTKDSFPAIRAWRANVKTGKFKEISPDGISCINEAGANYSG